MDISVWAPNASSMFLYLSGERVPMTAGAHGWWSIGPFDNVSLDYAFSIDGGPPLPDPRSPCQPFGVHGASRTVDHSLFPWTDTQWQAPPLDSAIVYELHIGTFTDEGTFDAAIDRIPHLLELGITHVELMPVAEFPGKWGWGYDGVYLYAPHQAYGGPDGLKRLVDAMHANGITVILDVVYNHLGPSGNYLQQYGPYFNDQFHTPWGAAVNLAGPHNAEVRHFFIDNALMWLRDYHFDGLRIDAVHALVDTSATHFLEELAQRVKSLEVELGHHFYLIAESDLNDPRLLRSADAGGYGLSAQWSDDFHHALHTVLTGERSGYYSDFGELSQLAKALECGFVYDGMYSEFRSRPHGRPLNGVPLSRLFGYIQNHDQIGNRARGERISALTSLERVKIAAALVLLGPFVPMIFQGEEWAASTPFQYFTDHIDPEVGRAVSQGRRREFAAFGWDPLDVPDPQAAETYQVSKLVWSELSAGQHQQMFQWYRDLIALRKQIPDVRSAPSQVTFDEERRLLFLRRGRLEVLCNLGDTEAWVPSGSNGILCASRSSVQSRDDAFLLPPSSVAIVASPDLLVAQNAQGSTGLETGKDLREVRRSGVAAQ